MLRIEVQHRKHLVRQLANVQPHVIGHLLRLANHRLLRQLLLQRAPRQLKHRHQLGAFGRANTLDSQRVVAGRLQHAGHAAVGL